MEEKKAYKSHYKGTDYEIRVDPIEIDNIKTFGVAVHSGDKHIGDVPDNVGSIDEAFKKGSKIIVAHHKNLEKKSMVTGETTTTPTTKEGDIKLTWVDDKDKTKIYSQIFPSVSDAVNNTKDKKDWLLLRVSKSEAGNDTWEVLNYGKYKKFKGERFVDSVFLKLGIGALAVVGVYFIVTKSIPFFKGLKLKSVAKAA